MRGFGSESGAGVESWAAEIGGTLSRIHGSFS